MTNINGSVGFSFVKVKIDSIVENQAFCHDNTSRPYTVNVLNSIGGGSLPHPGEHWTIDKTLGYWTFQCRIKAIPPTVAFIPNATTLSVIMINQTAMYNALLATGLIADSNGLTSIPFLAPVWTTFVNPPTGTVGIPYSNQFSALYASSYSVVPTTTLTPPDVNGIPDGLTFSSSGLLSGIPTLVNTYQFNIVAKGPGGTSTMGPITIPVPT